MRRDEFPIVDKFAKDKVNDVLDKIIAEIQGLRNCSCSCSDGIIDDVEDIIDKYRKNDTHDKTCMNCFHNYGVRHNVEFNPEDIVCEYWESDGLTKDDFCSRWKDKESEE